jgi:DNA invertase Pin-like site-specific DNA recombinase
VRVLTYHRVSAADHGEPVAVGLERLRRHVEGRGWTVAAECSDAAARHDTVRPGYRELRRQLGAGTIDAVVVIALHRIFPGPKVALLDLSSWLAAGRHLVALDDLVDTTRPEDGAAWRLVLEVLGHFERTRHSEATLIGMLRSQLARHGQTLGAGRPLVAVDLLEIQRLHADGLSRRQMLRALGRGGAPAPSYGTLQNRLRLLESAGKLDHEAHRRNHERRRQDRSR